MEIDENQTVIFSGSNSPPPPSVPCVGGRVRLGLVLTGIIGISRFLFYLGEGGGAGVVFGPMGELPRPHTPSNDYT